MTANGAENPTKNSADDSPRGRSTIEFPYLDLENAVEIADKVNKVGGTGCEWKQLAVAMNQAADGGGFRMRVMTAKVFGLLTYDRGNIELTDLGIQAIDSKYAKRALVDAFMKPALFKQLFERLNGVTLPPPAAVERMIEQMGVAPKQKDKARQVFMRSAKQAGLFELSGERMSIPPGANGVTKDVPPQGDAGLPKAGGGSGGGGGSNDGTTYDPFVVGLLRKLPPTDSEWAIKDRVKWLETAAKAFDLIYQPGPADDHRIVITAKKEEP
jgi:hypothetical protein